MTKRVLIFSLTYYPHIGGAEVAIKEITDRIDPSKYEFDMVTLRFDHYLPKIEKIGNVTVHRIGFTTHAPKVSDWNLPFILKLAKWIAPVTFFLKALILHRRRKYDMIWAMMVNYTTFGALLFKFTHPSIPYFLELQDGNSLLAWKNRQPILRAMWWLYQQCYTRADFIKVLSRFIEHEVARPAGYTGSLAVIPNAVDTSNFSRDIPLTELDALKRKFRKGPADVFLFTASRLVLSRGVEDVIRALPHLPPHIKFLIAGDGQDREKLEAIAEESGVLDRTIFAGHVDHKDLPAYLKISDIFVRPSIIEGFGNAFVEAMAAKIPVIATPVGGIPDFLFDPEKNPNEKGEMVDNPHKEPTGIFCNVHDPESVAEAVLRVLNNPNMAQILIKNAYALVTTKYDWRFIACDVEEKVFDRLTTPLDQKSK